MATEGKLWIARDGDGGLCLYREEPVWRPAETPDDIGLWITTRDKNQDVISDTGLEEYWPVNFDWFPNIKPGKKRTIVLVAVKE